MPDEENDKIMKDAADHYHPAYDDNAWEKMEQLLDQHLPQKKKRRKIIFFLLPMLLAGGLIFYIVAENGGKGAPPAQEVTSIKGKAEKSISVPLPSNTSSEEPKINQLSSGRKENLSQIPHINSQKNTTGVTGINSTYPIEKNKKENNLNNNNVTPQDETIMNQGDAAHDYDKNNSAVELPSTSSSVSSSNLKDISNQKENKQDTLLNIPVVKEPENIVKTEKGQKTPTKKETKRSKNNFTKNLGISVSAGPDISGVQLDNPGRIAINLGLGVSYAVSPLFTLRTGFYATKKIYSVGPDNYQATAGTGNYYYLENIDANCFIYSIPVNINYNFKKVKNHNWFLSTGLSSYLMKRESYEYYYKYPSGQTDTKDWTIHNQNQNFLSILNLSGGYQYFFNNRISVMAEPYINLPLSGVGAGKVKLKSGGILFTLTVKPFLKKEK
ncbi:MAG TPA: hypothetical protein VMU83_22885 [Hanamia sp.]|nr:hypothetical protein [Hanamia sp.]